MTITELTSSAPRPVADYDSGSYDYRSYWVGRDYEQRAEDAALGRLTPRLGAVEWFADLGGGFGRNVCHYPGRRAVLIDYSVNNLRTAAAENAAAIRSGRVVLVRADLNALPFRDGVLDAAMSIRVLHHLHDLDRALDEMTRSVSGGLLLDVPIKHHALAKARALKPGAPSIGGPAPLITGQTDHPFAAFHLATVRDRLTNAGFDTELAASVNNLRRWDRRLSPRAVAACAPAAHRLELAMQRLGRGWWGPNQFVLARRPATLSTPRSFQSLLRCVGCAGILDWNPELTRCRACSQSYPWRDGFWDFTLNR